MDLSGIISVSGMGGLFKVVSQIKNGFIVESLLDKKRMPVYASQKVSSLDDISVFTTGDDLSLKDALVKMRDKLNSAPAIDHKSTDEEIKKLFVETLPNYDKDRVYVSDMRKMVNWYNILQKNDLLKDKEEDKTEEGKEAAAKIKAEDKIKSAPKTNLRDTSSRPIKTTAGHAKVAGVRKSGSA